jgi:hypothetical protein
MNESKARKLPTSAGVYPNAFSIGRDDDEATSLVEESTGDYTVYYSERDSDDTKRLA